MIHHRERPEALTGPDGSAPAETRISYRGVGRIFTDGKKDFIACSGIDLDIRKGEFVCIIGPSGCGKSTLLNMAAGLLKPTVGTVTYDGRDITSINHNVGYCTQKDMLLPWRTTQKNVELALELRGVARAQRREMALAALEKMRLDGKGSRYPSQLSGGMLKRAALAQVLVYDPETLLMDEPFGALDAQLRMDLQRDLVRICEAEQKTVLFVTHDLEEAILLGDRVVVFGANPGRIIHVENIALERPRDLMTLRADPEFSRIWERLWHLLAPQIGEGS
mgnify:CR=1 FL=1